MNTLAIHAGHFAPHNTPFRERRELFFARIDRPEDGNAESYRGPDAEINAVIRQTRKDLSRVMGELLPERGETLLDSHEISTSLGIKERIKGTQETVEQHLREAFAESDMTPDAARAKLEQAQTLIQKLDQVAKYLNGMDANTEVIKFDPSMPQKALAVYDRSSGKILINKNLTADAKTENEALQHERAHAILDILTGKSDLFPGLITETLYAVRDTTDKYGESFLNLLYSLKDSGSYKHIDQQNLDAEEREEAFMEELLVRYADYKGQRSRTFHRNEIKLFSMLEENGRAKISASAPLQEPTKHPQTVLNAMWTATDDHDRKFADILFTLKDAYPYQGIDEEIAEKKLDSSVRGEMYMTELIKRYAQYQSRKEGDTFQRAELVLFDMMKERGQGLQPLDPSHLPRTHKSPKPRREGTMAMEDDEAKEKKEKKTSHDVIMQIEKLLPKLDQLRSLYLSVAAVAPEMESESQLRIRELEEETIPIQETKNLLTEVEQWENGNAEPNVCRALLDRLGHGDRKSIIDAVLTEKGIPEADWSKKPADIRSTVAQEISARIGFPEAMQKLVTEFEGYEENVIDKARKSVQNTLDERNEEKRISGNTGGKRMGVFAGIQFFSINEVIEVFKKVSKAYSDAWTERRTRREAELTSTIAEAVPAWPFGDTVRNTLLRETDSTLTSPDEEELKTLQSNRTHFVDLFSPRGRLEQMMKNPSTTKKAIAILEYAAERGWLYDIRKNDKQDEKSSKIIFGRYNISQLLPAHWSAARKHEWYLTLSSKNTGGIDHEIDHEYKAVHSVDKAPEFVKKFAHELHHLNYWGAIGIAKRALERGLYSEIGPWLSAELMAHLEHHREFAQNREIFDKMGLLTFANSMSTMSYFKWERDGFLNYAENPHMKIENSGTLGRTYKLLKEEILHHDRSLEHDHDHKLTLLIASAMAGKIIEVKGHKISIFADKYRPFNMGSGQQSKIDNIGDEDPDYYTDISDNIHGDETVYKQILQITGSGFFQLKERAGYFIERIIDVYQNHKDAGLTTEAVRMRDTVNRKLRAWLEITMRDTRSQSLIGERFGAKSKFNGRSVVVEAVKKGIIDFTLMKDAYDGKMQAHPTFVSAFFKELFKESETVNIVNYGTVQKDQFKKAFA